MLVVRLRSVSLLLRPVNRLPERAISPLPSPPPDEDVGREEDGSGERMADVRSRMDSGRWFCGCFFGRGWDWDCEAERLLDRARVCGNGLTPVPPTASTASTIPFI